MIVLFIYQIVVGIVGILGNGLVCLVIWRVSALHTRTNAFIFHQAVVDFLGSTAILLKSEVQLSGDVPLPDNVLGWVICWLSRAYTFFFFGTSTFNLLAVTMERYFAIVHPFKYQAAFFKYPRLKIGIIIAMCWILGASGPTVALTYFEVKNGRCSEASGWKTSGIFIILLMFVLPVCVMLFAYMRTGAELKRGAARVGPSSGHSATGMAESLLKARRNTFKTLLIVFITFLVCWTPNQVIIFLPIVGIPVTNSGWYFHVSVVIVATNSCVNPFIYACSYRQFRKCLRQMFCRKCSHTHNSDVGTVTQVTLMTLNRTT